jgi:hypothetical protein
MQTREPTGRNDDPQRSTTTRDASPKPQLLSAHLAEGWPGGSGSLVRRQPKLNEVPGLIWVQAGITAPLARTLPRPHGTALLAAWADDGALDTFLQTHPLAERLTAGWHVRLEPLRAFGAWPGLRALGEPEQAVDDDEPVVVITLGRLRLTRARAFLRASRPAEELAVADPATLLTTGIARPPGIVSTFSVWRSAREMRNYAVGATGPAHLQATRAQQQQPFHHDSIFARFRPHGATGRWHGLSPLVEGPRLER